MRRRLLSLILATYIFSDSWTSITIVVYILILAFLLRVGTNIAAVFVLIIIH